MTGAYWLRTTRWALVAMTAVLAFGLAAADVDARQMGRGPRPDVEAAKTASQVDRFVVGEITLTNAGERDATIDELHDSLELHAPPRHGEPAPDLPPGSSRAWYQLADVPVEHPAVLPAGETLVLPYSFDLCRVADVVDSNNVRNRVEVAVSDDLGEKVVHAKSDVFRAEPPECPMAILEVSKVDQDGSPIAGVELQVTFPDGTVESCTTDAAGLCRFEELSSGAYSVVEPAPPPDYVSGGCVPDEDAGADGAQVTLDDGEEATVICTNIRTVGEGSCLGVRACDGLTGIVGAASCNGFEACINVSGDVGDGACVGDLACPERALDVPDGSCTGVQACLGNTGQLGEGSCQGQSACLSNSGDIGDGSCTGTAGCTSNSGDIGNSSCQGSFACAGNTALIGDGQCIGDAVCQNNNVPMP